MINCVRFLNITDINEIGRMTLYEYDLLMTGKALQNIDTMHNIHQQAWLNRQVNATRKIGKNEVYVYKKFGDFFDYEKAIRQVTGEMNLNYEKDSELYDLLKKANV
ncbi:phage protein [Streptococcus suis]|nr:phage protein [Streptococcus suis]